MARPSVLLITLLLATAIAISPASETAYADSSWNTWAPAAWRYFNNCWNATTGLTHDSCGWPYFTLWGLASNIIGVTDAHKLGLATDSDFGSRVDKILKFLNTMNLTSNIPFGLYSSNTGAPAATSSTNPADYGRLLVALYVLKQHLLQLGYSARATQVDSAVSRVNNNYFAESFGGDLYGYYASLGFTLWNLIPSTTSAAQSNFQNLMQNGPFVASSSMYGVSDIPASTRIDGEPFIDAILEASEFPQVTGLPSWGAFIQLSRTVYDVQEKRFTSTGKPEFWTGGGLDFQPGFVSEWIVWTTGQTWVTPDLTDARLPVAYLKLMFAYNALYGTDYTSNMLNAYASILQTANGFKEGVYANGVPNNNLQVQTNQIMLSSARYANRSQTSTRTGSTTSVASSSMGSVSMSQTTATLTTHTTEFTSETALLAVLVAGIFIAVVIVRADRHSRQSKNNKENTRE